METKQQDQQIRVVQAMLFNPRLLPASTLGKPQEEDFQDAKLVYFYPKEELKDQQRNIVGLVEGNLLFYKDFNRHLRHFQDERLLQDPQDIFVIYTDHYIQLTGVFEGEFLLDMMLQVTFAKEPKASKTPVAEKSYLEQRQEEYKDKFEQIDKYILQQFFRHFVATYKLVYGPLSENDIDVGQKEGPIQSGLFATRFSHYISAYAYFYSQKPSQIPYQSCVSLQKYAFQGINYAPLDQTLALKVNQLLMVLKSQDKGICDHAVFYNGYYINSSLDVEHVHQLYDYFYKTHSPFTLGDSKLFKRFLYHDQNQDLEQEQVFFSVLGRRPQEVTQSETYYLLDEKYSQQIYLGETKRFLVLVYVKNLAVLLFYPSLADIKAALLLDLQKIVLQNQQLVTGMLEYQLQNNLNQEGLDVYFYANLVNYSINTSNLYFLKNIDTHLMSRVYSLSTQLMHSPETHQVLERHGNFYVLALKGNGRILTLLITAAQYEDLDKYKESLLSGPIFKNILF